MEKTRPRVTLVGEDGNAMSILARASLALKKAGYSEEERKRFRTEATSGDYDRLLQTVMEWCEVE